MSKKSYKELEQKLAEVEAALSAIQSGKVDLLIGDKHPLVFQLKTVSDEKNRLLQENQKLVEEWEKTFNSIDAAISILDNEQHILRYNKACSKYFDTNSMSRGKQNVSL